MSKFIGLFAASLALALLPAPAPADILQVGTHWPGTPCADIQSAVDAATDGDEIWVNRAPTS